MNSVNNYIVFLKILLIMKIILVLNIKMNFKNICHGLINLNWIMLIGKIYIKILKNYINNPKQ